MRHPDATYNPNTPKAMNEGLNDAHVRELSYGDWDRFEKLLKYYNGGSLLDAGCLNSPIGNEMKKKYPQSDIYSLDHADEVIDFYKKLYPKVNYICGNVYELPFGNKMFNYVVGGEVLEHLDFPEKFINEAYRILRERGVFAISTPLEEWKRQQGGEWHINVFTMDEVKK